MIIVKVELHSAITGRIELLGMMQVTNDGNGTKINSNLGDYAVQIMRKGTWEPLTPEETKAALVRRSEGRSQRRGVVLGHTRLASSVWTLVRKAIAAAGL